MTAPADKDPWQIGRALPGSDHQPLMTVIDQLYAAAVDPALADEVGEEPSEPEPPRDDDDKASG